MSDDPIVAEIREVRATHARRFNNDLLAIFHDLKAQEQKTGRKYVSYPARRIEVEDEKTNTIAA